MLEQTSFNAFCTKPRVDAGASVSGSLVVLAAIWDKEVPGAGLSSPLACRNAGYSQAALPNPVGICGGFLNKNFPNKYVQNCSLIEISFFCSKTLCIENSQAAADDKAVDKAGTR